MIMTSRRSAEARELHNLAIDKGVRGFLGRAGAAGIPLGPVIAADESDARAYAQEAATAWTSPNPVTHPAPGTLGAWVTRPGFTDVAVRPSAYCLIGKVSTAMLRSPLVAR